MTRTPFPLARTAALAVALVASAAGARAATAGPPGPMQALDDTGATRCLLGTAWSADCAGTGQDAAAGRDATAGTAANGRAGFRFTRVCASGEPAGTGTCPASPASGTAPDQWACTRDDVTGLLWELKTDDGSLRDQTRLVAMQEWGWGFPTATQYRALMDAASVCGRTDWDVPTLSELQSIVDYGVRGPYAFDAAWFPHTPTAQSYGTPYPTSLPNETMAAGYRFDTGRLEWHYPGDGTFVRVVARPPSTHGASARFEVLRGGGQVADRWTGLTWQRCPFGARIAADDAHCEGPARSMRWGKAMALPLAGTPWRVPNVKELASLVDLASGRIDPTVFPGLGNPFQSARLWSSTPALTRDARAWELWVSDGGGPSVLQSRTDAVRAVMLVRDH